MFDDSLYNPVEIAARTKEISDGWTPEERFCRQYARVCHSIEGGLFVPPINSYSSVFVQECKIIVQEKFIEEDALHCDCPYWMHE